VPPGDNPIAVNDDYYYYYYYLCSKQEMGNYFLLATWHYFQATDQDELLDNF